MLVKLVKYWLSGLCLCPWIVLASTENIHQLVPYEYGYHQYILLDHAGKVIIDKDSNIGEITYHAPYWVAESNNDIPLGNISQADDFKYAFIKKDNILLFKLTKNLTYLGQERIAYRYKDTDLSVLLDTDGHLITPKGSYYKKIALFVDNYAEVITVDNQHGYLDLQGRFHSHQPPNQLQAKVENVQQNNGCEALSADKIMFLCKTNEDTKLVNINTGKEVFVGKSAAPPFLSSPAKFQTQSDKFWIKNIVSGYHVYQIYDYDGNKLYENDFYNVGPFYGQFAAVSKKTGYQYQLINASGKILGTYSSIDFRPDGLIYAQSLAPIQIKNNQRYLTYIIDGNTGNILFYEEKINQKKNANCYHDIMVLKNSHDDIVWPVDLENECLLQRYINTPELKFADLAYKEKIVKEYPRIPVEKVGIISDYFIYELSSKSKTDFKYDKKAIYIVGPSKINLENIAELNLPQGYVYYETPHHSIDNCQRYIIPAYSKNQEMCIVIDNIGHIHLANENTFFDKNKQQVKQDIQYKAKSYPPVNYHVKYRHQQFDWIIDPEFDIDSQTLKFAYQYHSEHINFDYKQINAFEQKIVFIKFTNDNVVLIYNKNNGIYNQVSPIDWGKQIEVLAPYQYNPNTVYPCNKLVTEDSTLSLHSYDYLTKERCFPLHLTDFIYDYNQNLNGLLKNMLRPLWLNGQTYMSSAGR